MEEGLKKSIGSHF